MKNICLFILAIFMIPSSSFSQDNWSQFRGAKGDGTTTCTNLPTEWSNDKNVQWKIKIPGKGWASPIVWGDKVFIATAYPAAQEEPPTLQGGKQDYPRQRLST
jgi:outer membrane protein assembly factor BamB